MKKKRKLKPIPVVVSLLVVLLMITGIVLAVNANKSEKEDNKASVDIKDTDLRPQEIKTEAPSNSVKVEDTEVEILFDDTAAAVGTKFKVAALVIPDDSDKNVTWKSSNEAVFTVDIGGVVEIKGVGVATLSATVGNASDSIVIEGVKSVASGSSKDLPIYMPSDGGSGNWDGDTGSTGYSNSNGDDQGFGGNSSGDNGTAGGDNSSGGSQGGGNSSAGDGGSSGDNGSTGGGSTGGSGSTGGQGSQGGNNSSGGSGKGSSSGEIGGVLTGNGFDQTVSNVYVCNENGNYCGEIVTQPNVTIFYIKQRTASFDSRIRGVIETMLPGNSSQVWNNYLSSNTDRTFTVDGRTVRIVVANGGGHSQIVIYN